MEPLRRARALVTASLASDLDRLRALFATIDDVEVRFEPEGRLTTALSSGGWDAVLTTGKANEPFDAIVTSGLPIVLVADALDGDLAMLAARLGARVHLFAHGGGPLRQMLLHARREKEERALAERVRALVNVSVGDVVFRVLVEGDRFRFIEINPAFTKATGLGEEQVVGKFVDEVIPEPSLSLVLSKYREAIAERRTVRWDEITEYPTGTKYGEVSATPVVDATGRCTSLIGTVHDVTAVREGEKTIRLYADIVRAVQIGLSVWSVPDCGDVGSVRLVAANPEADRTSGTALSVRLGERLVDLLPGPSGLSLVDLVCAVARDREVHELPTYSFEQTKERVFRVKTFPVDGSVGLAVHDVSADARARAVNAVERKVLELVAAGAPLGEVLTTLAVSIEELSPPAVASVLLVSNDGRRIRYGAAPHLPEAYARAMNDMPVGLDAGPCGVAAAKRESLIVPDIQADPRWAEYGELAQTLGLRACWSTPIYGSDTRVLGVFALYYRAPRAPSTEELHLIERATHVAGIAIQRSELDEQMRELTARIEGAREEERTGIAREIHDQLGQSLTAITMDLAWINRRVGSPEGLSTEALHEKLKELALLTQDTIKQVRRISAELRPGVLDDLGLTAALGWQAQEFAKRTGVACSVRADADDKELSRDVSTAVFRVFQEALTNIARHAHATNVEVHLSEQSGMLVLTVRDDGRGIRAEDVRDPRSLGLLGMRERARRLHGTASFSPVAPHGTLVTLRLPISQH